MIDRVTRLLQALDQAGVEYLIVGGVAVAMHGHLRVTKDLDLVVRLEPANTLRAVQALTSLGLRPRAPVAPEAFADPAQREDWIANKNMLVFSMWDPRDPTFDVDLFVREPFDFSTAYSRRVESSLDDVRATVVALEDLLELKRQAGRPQDLLDIEALIALHSEDE